MGQVYSNNTTSKVVLRKFRCVHGASVCVSESSRTKMEGEEGLKERMISFRLTTAIIGLAPGMFSTHIDGRMPTRFHCLLIFAFLALSVLDWRFGSSERIYLRSCSLSRSFSTNTRTVQLNSWHRVKA